MSLPARIPPYIQGADLPDTGLELLDYAGNLIDFSAGWTFQVKVGTPGSAAVLTKSSGIVGTSTVPNVIITWATSGDLNTLTPGQYTLDLIATRTSDSKQRVFRFVLPVHPSIT